MRRITFQSTGHQCLVVSRPSQHLSSTARAIPPALPHVGTSSNLFRADGIIITGCEFGDDAESFCNYNYGEFNFAGVGDASDEILKNLLS